MPQMGLEKVNPGLARLLRAQSGGQVQEVVERRICMVLDAAQGAV